MRFVLQAGDTLRLVIKPGTETVYSTERKCEKKKKILGTPGACL